MELQNTFYVLGIIYMVLNIAILVAIGMGILVISRKVFDIHKQVTEKLKAAEEAIKHPEGILANVGMAIFRAGLRGIKQSFFGKKDKDSD